MKTLPLVLRSFFFLVVCLQACRPIHAQHLPSSATSQHLSQSPTSLTLVSAIRQLTAERAAAGLPVHLHGIVTAFSGYKQSFFFLDHSAGISVDRLDDTQVQVGDEIDIDGSTNAGMFAPVVLSSKVSVVRHTQLPSAPLFAFEQLKGGLEDSQWIEVQGVVHAARPMDRWGHHFVFLSLELEGGPIDVYLQDWQGIDYGRLVDATVRLRGVCASDFNQKRQFVNLTMFVPRAADLEMLRPSPTDPFAIGPVTIRNVMQFNPASSSGHRVMVRGVVTYQNPGHSIYVEDSSDGIRVETATTERVVVGQEVEVVGFPKMGNYSPILSEGQLQSLNKAGSVVPDQIRAVDVISQKNGFFQVPYDQQLVRLQGSVVETHIQGDQQVWLLKQAGRTFEATLPRQTFGNNAHEAAPGSIVTVTGVCDVYADMDRAPVTFTILMRLDRDIQIDRVAPWWTINHAVDVLLAFGAVVAAVLLWGGSLKRQVLQKTRLLDKQQNFLNRACRLASVGCWEIDLLSGEVSRSPESYRILGAPPDYRPTAEQAIEIYPPEYRPVILEAMQTAKSGGDGWDLELPVNTIDGRRIWVRVVGAAEFNQGVPVRLIGVFQDITQQIENQDALRKSQDFLDRTGRLAGVGGWELVVDSGDLAWSEETCRIHGVPPDHKPTLAEALAFYTPESRKILEEAISRAMLDGQGWDLELKMIRTDGRTASVRAVGTVEAEQGHPVRFRGAFQDISAQVAEKEELRRANERVSLATDSGGIGIWDWDICGNVLVCDARMYQIHGKSPDEAASDSLWRSHIHPEDQERVLRSLEEAVAGTKPYDIEFRILWKDGTIRNLRGAARVTRDGAGTPLHMIGVNWDITSQRHLEAGSKMQHERLSLATDCSGIGIWELDVVTGAVEWDEWMHRLHGTSPVDTPASFNLWLSCLHPEDVEKAKGQLQRAIEGPVPFDTEFRVVWPDQTVRYIRATGRLTRDHEGKALRIVGANWDITDSIRLTEEVAKQHELLQVTLQSIGDGVITTDAQAKVTWLNPVAELMTGWLNAEAIGQPVTSVLRIVDENTKATLPSPVETCLEQMQTAYMAEGALLLSRSGLEFGIEDSAAPIFNANGEAIGAVVAFHDVTEQRRHAIERQQLADAAMEMKDRFLSHVSHELRSPLSSIYSFTSIMADGLAGDMTPQQEEYLQIVLKNSIQLGSMIEDLLTVTREREGKLSIDLEATDISEAVVEASNTVTMAAQRKVIKLSARASASPTAVQADPIRLRQILIILLDNAN